MNNDTVRTRPLLGSDAAALTDFYLGLTPLTVHARFFVDSLHDPRGLGLSAVVDQRNHLAVVAEHIHRKGATIVGDARAVVSPHDPTQAEFAVVVADDWQRSGIGTALVRHLARNAWHVGVERWHVLRLVGNDRVDRLLSRVAIQESSTESGGVVEATFRLLPTLTGITT
jgi:acetyltransferase